MPQTELKTRIENMIQEIEDARINLSQGKDFGLEDIGSRVAGACAEVTALPDEISVTMRPLLETLRADLMNFSDELGEISRRLKEIDAAEKAEAEAGKDSNTSQE